MEIGNSIIMKPKGSIVDTRFIITVRVTAGYTFYYPSAGLNNTTISWGDGQSGVYSGGVQTHTYTNAGDYQIVNSGVMSNFNFYTIATTSRNSIIRVDNGGIFLDTIVNPSTMFRQCTNLTTVYGTFKAATQCVGTFYVCTNLTSLPTATFENCTYNYEQFINCYNLTSLPKATFAKLETGQESFNGCISLVTLPLCTFENMVQSNYMFKGCTSLKLLPFVTFAKLVDGRGTFDRCTLNTVDYSNILIRTAAVNPPNSTSFNGGYSKYNSTAVAARASLITNDLWIISDGGLE